MPDPILLAKAIALAAAVAAYTAWLIGRFGQSTGSLSASLPGACGTALGILSAAWVIGLAPRMPPQDALDRFFLVLVPAVVLAEAVIGGRAKWVLRATVAALAAPVLVHGSSYVRDLSGPGTREWTPAQTAVIFTALAVLLFLEWTLLGWLASRAGRSTAVAVAFTASGAALGVMLSGYATGGQLGLPLAAAVGVFALVGSRFAAGAVGVAVVGLFSLLVIGNLFAGLTVQNALVLFMAPLLAWAPELPVVVRRFGPKTRGTLRIAWAIIPVVITLWLAQLKFAADSKGSAEAPGEAGLSDYANFGK
jgi:hypothetical protein